MSKEIKNTVKPIERRDVVVNRTLKIKDDLARIVVEVDGYTLACLEAAISASKKIQPNGYGACGDCDVFMRTTSDITISLVGKLKNFE